MPASAQSIAAEVTEVWMSAGRLPDIGSLLVSWYPHVKVETRAYTGRKAVRRRTVP